MDEPGSTAPAPELSSENNVQLNDENEEPQEMDVLSSTASVSESPSEVTEIVNDDKEEVPMEVVKDDECTPARLVIKGMEDDEETVIMTIEEAIAYVNSKVESYIRDPKINPLLILKNQIATLHDTIQAKSEEFVKLNKMFDALFRDQVKFLRHIEVFPKLDTKTVGVSVDLPWLPDAMSGILREDLLKKNSENGSSGANGGGSATAAKPAKKDPSGPIECIDLTDDMEEATASTSSTSTQSSTTTTTTVDTIKNKSITITPVVPSQNTPSTSAAKSNIIRHPAPLPVVEQPPLGNAYEVMPKPDLSISVDKNGIVLQWDYPPEVRSKKVMGYEIVGYQEKSHMLPSMSLWKKIGCVTPMPLPMSCTLTQFVEGYKYHFSIRALDKNCKPGQFSDPASIMFVPEMKKSGNN